MQVMKPLCRQLSTEVTKTNLCGPLSVAGTLDMQAQNLTSEPRCLSDATQPLDCTEIFVVKQQCYFLI